MWLELKQRWRNSADVLTRRLSPVIRVPAPLYLPSSARTRIPTLSLWVALPVCSRVSRTIEGDGCAWQSYWAEQPEYRWRSPLKSLPSSPACKTGGNSHPLVNKWLFFFSFVHDLWGNEKTWETQDVVISQTTGVLHNPLCFIVIIVKHLSC